MAEQKRNVKGSGQNGILVDVIIHPMVMRWLSQTAHQDTDGFCRLVESNNKRFHRMFGKPTWNADGKDGWTEGWAVSENGLNWMVLSSPKNAQNPGITKFKVVLSISEDEFKNNAKMGLGITGYLQDLMQKLMGEE